MTDDRGFTLPEILVCMPLCLMLMTALVAAYGVISQNYIKAASQWAYIEEIRILTDMVRQKVRYAESIKVVNSHTLWIHSKDFDKSKDDKIQFYVLQDNKGVFSLNGQPVSNDNIKKYVNIREITFEKTMPHKVIMRLTLENKATGRVATIEKSLYSRLIWLKERYGESGDG